MGKYKLYNENTSIPSQLSDVEVLYMVKNNEINSNHLVALKNETTFSDDEISKWLNINVKTFRAYKKTSALIKPDIQEHTIKLLSLIRHGTEVFGSVNAFSQWLNTNHLFLDFKKPADFLNTISGIKFIDNRLYGIEYGDNI